MKPAIVSQAYAQWAGMAPAVAGGFIAVAEPLDREALMEHGLDGGTWFWALLPEGAVSDSRNVRTVSLETLQAAIARHAQSARRLAQHYPEEFEDEAEAWEDMLERTNQEVV